MRIYSSKRRVARYNTIEGERIRTTVRCPVCGVEQSGELERCIKCNAELEPTRSDRQVGLCR